MMYRLREPEFRHVDTRGELVQLKSESCAQVNVLKSHAGVIRGGHYHKYCTETFYIISGAVEVSFSQGKIKDKRKFQSGDLFEVPPYTVHKLHFLEECVMVVLYDRPIEVGAEKDIYSEVNL